MLSCRDEPSLEMFIFLYVTSVLVSKFGGMERGRGRSEHVPRVVCETLKQWVILAFQFLPNLCTSQVMQKCCEKL